MQPNAIEMQSKTTITMGHRFIGIEGKSQKLQPRMIENAPTQAEGREHERTKRASRLSEIAQMQRNADFFLKRIGSKCTRK